MGRRLLQRWEGLTGRGRILLGIPVAVLVLFAFHQAFPLLSWQERLMYSLMEAVPLALLAAWATQNELRRRLEREHPDADDVSR